MNVTAKYPLSETDYLNSQLFFASKSDECKKARRRNLHIRLCLYIIVTFFLFNILKDDTFPFWIFFVIWTSIIFLSVFRTKYIYKKHYLKHIRSVYKDDFDKINELTFTDDTIDVQNHAGTSSTFLSQIVEINEVEKYFFLHLQTLGKAFIIPKEKLQNLAEISCAVNEISKKFNIKYNVDLTWKWK